MHVREMGLHRDTVDAQIVAASGSGCVKHLRQQAGCQVLDRHGELIGICVACDSVVLSLWVDVDR